MSGYTQLQIVLPANTVNFSDFTYRLTIVDYNVTPRNEAVSSGVFDASGMSARHATGKLDVEIYYDVFVQGQFVKKISCKAYPKDSKLHSIYRFKATADSTHPESNHLKEVVLDSNEVAWYLVKRNETMGALMNRIYQQPPGAAEWKVLADNNPHLAPVNMLKNLLPGQVVVLANSSKTTAKLSKYRALAKEAEANRSRLHRQHNNFDAGFMAQNYEFFHDAMDAQAGNLAWLSHQPVPTLDGAMPTEPSTGMNYGAIAKGAIDGALEFSKTVNKEVMEAHAEIIRAMAREKKAGSRLANPKNFREFRAKYANLYARLDHALGRKVFTWNTGTKTSNLRRVIQRDAFVRGANYKGGLEAYAKNLPKMGRVSHSLKLGGNLLFAYDAFGAGHTIYDAAGSGDSDKLHNAVSVEPLKLSGSVIGAELGAKGGTAFGAFIAAVTVGTGGVAGIVIIGICAVAGGFAVGAALGKLGEIAGDQLYQRTR